MAQTKESLRQVKDAAEHTRKTNPEKPVEESRFKPEPAGYFRGARIKPK